MVRSWAELARVSKKGPVGLPFAPKINEEKIIYRFELVQTWNLFNSLVVLSTLNSTRQRER